MSPMYVFLQSFSIVSTWIESARHLSESDWRKMTDDSTISELLRGLKKLYTVSRSGLGRYVTFSSTEYLGPPSMGTTDLGRKTKTDDRLTFIMDYQKKRI